MASSRKSNRSDRAADDLAAHVRDRLKDLVRPGEKLALGLSGGVDSTVLLHVLAALRPALRCELSAVHVNHRISPNADAWAAFCRAAAERSGVSCRVIEVRVESGNSLERAAREARYAALRSAGADCIVLAHNLDDQAETVLLQLMRGGGVRGLAGMPLARNDAATRPSGERGGSRILRPLIGVTRADIESYATAHGLEWIEDESNDDTQLARNWVRHTVLPLIAERVPGVRATLSRTAAHMAEAATLLDDLARIDAGDNADSRRVNLAALRMLSRLRQKNLLRFLIACGGWPMPPSDRLDEALRQGAEARRDASVRVDLGACELRRHADALYLLPKTPPPPALPLLTWQGEEAIELSGWGTLAMIRTHGEGLSAVRLADAAVTIRSRTGGERMQPHAARPRRTVKNLLQEAGLAPWERKRLPYVYCGDRLVCVPGVAIDCRFEAVRGEPGIVPVWRPSADL